ncbi:hypothetical protein BOTBODRAFT_117777 [Botryobasidium botryosum FD-172 SS1]|uniref:Cytosol aminopeptidase domain-containing protein n=1 Tax=Botryobasidium botryosum (strain FD-172 SS1) TaxID=930990 RepID=A0A067MBR0_BOTB1|nr:hypothetical protein BOTBODRAFT_117777 [Botryobasidium botryosum FD-172 SS1]
MSSAPDAYLVPLDPQNPPSSVGPGGLNPAVLWESARPKDKAGEARLFYNADQKGALAALVSLGPKVSSQPDKLKDEAVRKAAGIGAKNLKDAGAKHIGVDASRSPRAAAEGTALALFEFTLKTDKANAKKDIQIKPLGSPSEPAQREWDTGLLYAGAQNLARELKELPANMLTPTSFCERIEKEFQGVDNVELHIRDKAWAEEKGMRTFLSVTKGSSEPPKFLEIHYRGAPQKDAAPLAFVGKGITFDSGGISLKPATDMKLMRADMGGAAAVASAALAIAKLRVPINLVVVTPLCENLPGPSANKPGDVIYAMNGKTIEIDNTDAEGRLILAGKEIPLLILRTDALYYASSTFKPHTVIDAATLTGAMVIALGGEFSGVFSNSDSLWEELYAAGESEFDRFWRMPLDEAYMKQISGSNADLCNTGGRPAGSCTAAIFLKEFVDGVKGENGEEPRVRWAHLDIAGTMEATRPDAYQTKGMTGRPVRALIEFARRLAEKN